MGPSQSLKWVFSPLPSLQDRLRVQGECEFIPQMKHCGHLSKSYHSLCWYSDGAFSLLLARDPCVERRRKSAFLHGVSRNLPQPGFKPDLKVSATARLYPRHFHQWHRLEQAVHKLQWETSISSSPQLQKSQVLAPLTVAYLYCSCCATTYR